MNILATIFLLASAGSSVSAQCPLPTTYKWVGGGVLAVPKKVETSLQDFTHVPHNGKHLVYASYAMRNASYSTMVLGPFSEWSDMASVDQIQLPDGVAAPTLFFYQPGNI
jgi:endo-1,4-beta-xylanase